MYAPSQVLSVSKGVLDEYLHTAGGKALGAAVLPILPGLANGYTGQRYGRYEVRFRAASVPGFKIAWLLWPDSEVWPRDGEIDFPEANLNSRVTGAVFRQNARGSVAKFMTSSRVAGSWHTAILQWQPGLVTMTLDGKVVGRTTTKVPNTPMHWVLQTEACQGVSARSHQMCPAKSSAGHVQIDWVTAYTRS